MARAKCGLPVQRFDFDAEVGAISDCIDFADFRKFGGSKSLRTVEELPKRLLGGELDGLVMVMEGNAGSHFGAGSCVVSRAWRRVNPGGEVE